MIVLSDVTKQYGKKESRFTALDAISLSIKDGSSVAIIGKSGSGKSTLMHIMSGLDSPTSGSVEIGGKLLAGMKHREMDNFRATQMSFIFQSFYVEGNLTCYENVMLPLEISRVPFSKRKDLIMNALEAVELQDKAGELAVNLSGGQKQRLSIARAIVNKPQILFADEPTGNLDSVTGDKIIRLLFDLNKRLPCTLILVTHDADLAARCKVQVHLQDGHITDVITAKRGRESA